MDAKRPQRSGDEFVAEIDTDPSAVEFLHAELPPHVLEFFAQAHEEPPKQDT